MTTDPEAPPVETTPLPTPDPGVHGYVPFDEYVRWDAMSQSRCKTLDDYSALELRWQMDHPKPSTDAQKFGSATHKILLEAFAFFDEYVVAPVVNKRTKAGKAKLEDLRAMYPEKELVDAGDYAKIQGMLAATGQHADARQHLTGGRAEVPITWDDDATGG